MLHEEKRKHNKEQQASNLIMSELVKTNKTTVFRKNSRINKNNKINKNTFYNFVHYF